MNVVAACWLRASRDERLALGGKAVGGFSTVAWSRWQGLSRGGRRVVRGGPPPSDGFRVAWLRGCFRRALPAAALAGHPVGGKRAWSRTVGRVSRGYGIWRFLVRPWKTASGPRVVDSGGLALPARCGRKRTNERPPAELLRGLGLFRRLPEPSATKAIWLILPVVICLSQRLSHACLSTNFYTVKLRMAH